MTSAVTYLFSPQGHYAKLAAAYQRVGPVDFEGETLEYILRDLVKQAEGDLEVIVCASALREPITLRTRKPASLKSLLDAVALQVGCRYRAFSGQHGQIFRPSFHCWPDEGDIVLIGGREGS